MGKQELCLTPKKYVVAQRYGGLVRLRSSSSSRSNDTRIV